MTSLWRSLTRGKTLTACTPRKVLRGWVQRYRIVLRHRISCRCGITDVTLTIWLIWRDQAQLSRCATPLRSQAFTGDSTTFCYIVVHITDCRHINPSSTGDVTGRWAAPKMSSFLMRFAFLNYARVQMLAKMVCGNSNDR